LALALKAILDAGEMPAGPVDAVALLGVDGDVAIGRPSPGGRRGRLNDHAPANLLDPRGIGELHAVDPSIHAVDPEKDPLAPLVSGQTLGEDAADHGLVDRATIKGVLPAPTFFREALIGKRPVHGLDDVVTLAELLQGDLGLTGEHPASGLDLRGESI